MFHKFKLETPRPDPRLIAVGVVMPSGKCHVEYLEEDVLKEDEAPIKTYEVGVAGLIADIYLEGYEFQWFSNPQEVSDPKLKTEFDSEEIKEEVLT